MNSQYHRRHDDFSIGVRLAVVLLTVVAAGGLALIILGLSYLLHLVH